MIAPHVLAIFGPTGSGKTALAIAVAERLRVRGEAPVAVSCDAIQLYRGLEVLSGAPTAPERACLPHRLVGVVDPGEEWSAGRFADLAHGEIDSLLRAGRRPILVGGTGLYLRAALSELELRAPVDSALRAAVEQELSERGPAALHSELDPETAAAIHPNDRKRIARSLELQRAGIEPPRGGEGIWTAALRHPTVLVGLAPERDDLRRRIERRVEQMAAAGAGAEAGAVSSAGASRTARAAIGFDAFLAGDLASVKQAHVRYARRQLTWMRRMEGVEVLETAQKSPSELASEVIELLDGAEGAGDDG